MLPLLKHAVHPCAVPHGPLLVIAEYFCTLGLGEGWWRVCCQALCCSAAGCRSSGKHLCSPGHRRERCHTTHNGRAVLHCSKRCCSTDACTLTARMAHHHIALRRRIALRCRLSCQAKRNCQTSVVDCGKGIQQSVLAMQHTTCNHSWTKA